MSEIEAFVVTRFRASDRAEFDTKEEAEAHEMRLSIDAFLNRGAIFWRETTSDEVACYLIKNKRHIIDLLNGE